MEDFRERHVCGSGPAPPRPPFVQMKNTGGSFPRGGFPGAAFGIVGSVDWRKALPLPIVDIAAEFTVLAVVPINQPTSQTLGPRSGERASRASEVVIAGSAWHQEGHGLPTAQQKTPIVAAPFFKTRACASGNFPPFPALPCCGPCPKNGLTTSTWLLSPVIGEPCRGGEARSHFRHIPPWPSARLTRCCRLVVLGQPPARGVPHPLLVSMTVVIVFS